MNTILVMEFLVTIVTLSSVAAAESQHRFPAFFNLDDLMFGGESNGRFASHSFEYEDAESKAKVRLRYNVEHSDVDDVIDINKVAGLSRLECFDSGEMRMIFADAVAANRLVTDMKADESEDIAVLLAGSHHWGCHLHSQSSDSSYGDYTQASDEIGDRRHRCIQRRVVKVKGIIEINSEFLVILQTTHAHITEFFKNADIEFSTNVFPRHEYTADHPIHDSVDTDRRRRYGGNVDLYDKNRTDDDLPATNTTQQFSWTDVWSYTWEKIQTLGNTVKDTVDTVLSASTALVPSNYDNTLTIYSTSFEWNYESPGRSKQPVLIDTYASCYDCYVYLTGECRFHLKITSFQLISTELRMLGSLDAMFSGRILADVSRQAENSRVLTTIRMTPIPFTVGGVTMQLLLTMPVTIGYSAIISADALIGATITITGECSFGVQYAQSDGFHAINDFNLLIDNDVIQPAYALSHQLELYVLPTFVSEVTHLGNANSGFKSFFELIWDSESSNCGVLGLQLAFGLQWTIGASLDISLAGYSVYKNKWESDPLYSKKVPLIRTCTSLRLLPLLEMNTNATMASIADAVEAILLSNDPKQIEKVMIPHDVLDHDLRQTKASLYQPHKVADSWYGCFVADRTRPGCSNFFDFGEIYMQVVEIYDQELMYFITSNNIRMLDQSGRWRECVAQVEYEFMYNYDYYYPIRMTPDPFRDGKYEYYHCDDGTSVDAVPLWGYFYDDRMDTMWLEDDQGCMSMLAYRGDADVIDNVCENYSIDYSGPKLRIHNHNTSYQRR